jgi:hypothetical protein
MDAKIELFWHPRKLFDKYFFTIKNDLITMHKCHVFLTVVEKYLCFYFVFFGFSILKEMPKIKPTVDEWIQGYRELKFESGKLICRACLKTVSFILFPVGF